MAESSLFQRIANKEDGIEIIAAEVVEKPELVVKLVEGLGNKQARVKYGCEKVLRMVSERKPEILYPHFDLFVRLLDGDNTFLKWGSIHILANLAAVDIERKFDRIFDRYFAPIPGPSLIPAANTIGGAAKIALAKPELIARITRELLKVEKAEYQTTECLNVALGQVINSFEMFFDQVEDKAPVISLVKRQLKNTRSATRKKAEAFIKRRGL